MKILLLGATGMIGSRILDEAVVRGHEVVAASRKGDAAKGRAVAVDVTDGAAVAEAGKGAQVVVLAVSPRSTGDAVTEMMAIGSGAIAGAKALGARLVIVGGAGTLDLPDGTPVLNVLPEFIVPEATGMKALRDSLAITGLDWTFIAPSAEIAPGTKTGVFRVGGGVLLSDAEGKSHISAEDFAVGLMDEVETPTHQGAVMTLGY